jgi:serine/threonine protein kinase
LSSASRDGGRTSYLCLRAGADLPLQDIYSFAVIVWEMLTGMLPWQGFTPLAVAYSVTLMGTRLPLHAISPERCPPALSQLLRQCFDAEPRRRPAAAELVKELEIIAEVGCVHGVGWGAMRWGRGQGGRWKGVQRIATPLWRGSLMGGRLDQLRGSQ